MLQQGMLSVMVPVQTVSLGLVLIMEQGPPKEDTLPGPVQIKSQNMARVHTQTEDLGSTPRTCKLDIASKAPKQLDRNGAGHL